MRAHMCAQTLSKLAACGLMNTKAAFFMLVVIVVAVASEVVLWSFGTESGAVVFVSALGLVLLALQPINLQEIGSRATRVT